jgi:hypothetical protein
MRPRYLEFLIFFSRSTPERFLCKETQKKFFRWGYYFQQLFFLWFFFSPLANEIESHFVVKRPDRPDGYYVVYNITMSIRESEKMPPPTRLETLFSLSVPRNKETNI